MARVYDDAHLHECFVFGGLCALFRIDKPRECECCFAFLVPAFFHFPVPFQFYITSPEVSTPDFFFDISLHIRGGGLQGIVPGQFGIRVVCVISGVMRYAGGADLRFMLLAVLSCFLYLGFT